jgi:hypothetical protein
MVHKLGKIEKAWKGQGYRYYVYYRTLTMYNKLCRNKKEALEAKKFGDGVIRENLDSRERGRIRKL